MVLGVISILSIIAGIIFIGFIAELAFRKTKIPDVIFLIIIGILLSSVFHLVDRDGFGIGSNLFTTFTLLFLLFQGAMNIEFKTLFQSFKGAVKLTVISFILTAIVVSLISIYILKYPPLISILLGMILGGTSSAVVIPFVNNLNMDKKYGSVLTIESAISDVLCIVGAITVLAIIQTGNIATTEIVKTIITSFLLAACIGVIAAIAWIFLLYKSPILAEYHMVTIALLISIYSFVESPFVKASGAIAALSFGLMLGNSKPIIRVYSYFSKNSELNTSKNEVVVQSVLSDKASGFYSEISFFVKVFFFVYLGILMDFSNPIVFVYGGLLTLGIFIVRPFAVKLSFWGESIDKKSKNILRVLAPKGLAAAVLAEVVIQAGIPAAAGMVNLVFSVILISIVTTSILVFLTQRGKVNPEFKPKEINKSQQKK